MYDTDIRMTSIDSTESQKKKILAALQRGERLTALNMLFKFGVMQASARICELRAEGHNIETNWLQKGKKRFVEYYIDRT